MVKIETKTYFLQKRAEFSELTESSTKERLYKMFMLIMKYYEDKQKLRFWRWLILIDSDDLREKCALIIREHESRFLDILKETFTSGISNGEIKEQSFKALMHTYIVLIHGTLDGLMFYENFLERDEFINNVWSIFWEGIKAGKQEDQK